MFGHPSDPLAALRDLLPRLTALVTVVSLVWALITGLGNDEDTPGHGAGDGSSTEEPGYVPPGPDVQLQLEQIRTDLMQAVLELRHREGVPPVVMDARLQIHAQDWAERTAVLGREEPSPANVAMVQANLPLEGASGYAILEQWLQSEPHTAVLLDPAHVNRGVGLAVGHGRVWAVVQLSA